jgi:hypothetical protein
MFVYPDGSKIMVGDSVLFERGRTPGVVELIVTSDEQMKDINVEEPGIMLKSPPFGRVYLPLRALEEDPLILVSRVPQPDGRRSACSPGQDVGGGEEGC